METFRFDPALRDGKPVSSVVAMKEEFESYEEETMTTQWTGGCSVRFEPLKKTGKIVVTRLRVPVGFELKPRDSTAGGKERASYVAENSPAKKKRMPSPPRKAFSSQT